MSENLKWQIGQWEQFTTKRYDTITEVMASSSGEFEFESLDSQGRFQKESLSEVIEGIKKVGLWGYVEDHTIHFWLDDKLVIFDEFLFFLGHEIGHIIENIIHADDMTGVESKCDGYGFTAKEAYRLALSVMELS